jgi:hypothetical protein
LKHIGAVPPPVTPKPRQLVDKIKFPLPPLNINSFKNK